MKSSASPATATLQLCYIAIRMPQTPLPQEKSPELLYCPRCGKEVTDPLICGDCSAIICRTCGTPLESPDELGIG